MLVDINFKPFDPDHVARYAELVHQHNEGRSLDEHLPLELTRPPRIGLGIYQGCNFHLDVRDIVERVVEDLPEYRGALRGEPSLDLYFQGQRAYQRRMNKLYSQTYHRGPYRDFMGLGAYCLCDHPQQFLEDYPHIKDDDVPRILSVTPIFREHQPSSGGFRYHKNGPYVGRQRPRHEYLYNDTHIDLVCSIHVWRVEDVKTG